MIKAIAIDGAREWNEIREFTGLSAHSLNTALSEMYNAKIIEKSVDGRYTVEYEIYKEYKAFFEKQRISEKSIKFLEEKQRDLVDWINQWKEVERLDFSLEPKHFFLNGTHLDNISQGLISNAKSEALVVNPYVENCDLSNTLRNASRNDVKVNLITRPPYNNKRREYHTFLKQDGVQVTYNKVAHAKLIAVDRIVTVISSMNFTPGSSGGASWEAGLVSTEETVVESVCNSILELLEKPESKDWN